jgi:drug/metabolite transporter (DMT)-like permease
MSYFGEVLALAVAILWSFGTILFGYSSRQVGPLTVNVMRIPIAAGFLLVLNLIVNGAVLPDQYSFSQIVILAVSGFIGLVLGDSCYFKSLVILGPRISSLMAAASPVFAVIVSWIFLNQSLTVLNLVGIAVTLVGISSVTLEKDHDTFGAKPGPKGFGYFLGICGSLCQAVAITMAKVGMGDNIPPSNATFIRMVAASALIWIIAPFRGKIPDVRRAISNRRVLYAIFAAAICGPTIGVWLSLMSVKYTKIGIASTLMATTPLWVIPLVMIIHKERPSGRAIVGTVVAVGGVALLFLH